MLIKHVLVYKSLGPDTKEGKLPVILKYEIDYDASSNGVGVDPAWL